jgi:Nickel responsive protein SCO4226-like
VPATFLIETYLPGGATTALESLVARARGAAEAACEAGIPVRHVRSFLAPDDEMCFHVFEADSAADAIRAADLGRLDHDRITEVIE